MDLKTLKSEMTKAEKKYRRAERNYNASLRFGSEKQRTTCYDNMVKRYDTFRAAQSDYYDALREQPSLGERAIERFKKSPIAKKVTTGTGIAIAGVIAVVAGVSIFRKSNSEGDSAATDTV